MSLKIESLPQLTTLRPPTKGETGDHRLVHHRKAETNAALIAGVKARARSNDRRVQMYLDQIAGRHP
jgi:hypothetical protein